MFNDVLATQDGSPSVPSLASDQIMRQIMDGLDNKKQKRHSKGKKKSKGGKKHTADETTSLSQADLYCLGVCVGATQEKNKTLESMLRLALAGQKGTLRTDVLETGFEILDDGES